MARVAVLIHNLAGAGKVALTTARGLIERGHAVDLLFLEPGGVDPNDVPDGMRFFFVTPSIGAGALERCRRELNESEVFSGAVIPEPAASDWQRRHESFMLILRLRRLSPYVTESLARTVFKVVAYVDQERPDAVLAIGMQSPLWMAFAHRLSAHRARLVVTLNGWLSPTWYGQTRYTFSRADAVVAVSRGCARFAVDVIGTSTPVHHVYSPLADSKALRKAADPVDHPWIGGDVPVVLSVARLEKDYPTLLRAVALLAARRPVRLIALGQGREAARLRELQDLAQSLGIAGAVDFAGFAANPFAYMARAELFVLSSKHEGMPQVLVQAMMVGCRMVATDCDFGPAELLGGGSTAGWPRSATRCGWPRRWTASWTRRGTPPVFARAAELFDVERSIDAYEALLVGAPGGSGAGRGYREPR